MVQHVTAQHLTRLACLYVRQSTLQQVMENTESTSRQYALRERARALGWAEERIVVIDQRGHREGDGWGSGRQNR
jgi:DNA invertase Pin-like site-specific DNA recombinase